MNTVVNVIVVGNVTGKFDRNGFKAPLYCAPVSEIVMPSSLLDFPVVPEGLPSYDHVFSQP